MDCRSTRRPPSRGTRARAADQGVLRVPQRAARPWATNALAAGVSRTAVAQALLDSVEGLTVQITGIYVLALQRAPDLAGGTFWAPQVRFGDRRFVLAALTASDEFFALSTAG